jgi:hypothetical protein
MVEIAEKGRTRLPDLVLTISEAMRVRSSWGASVTSRTPQSSALWKRRIAMVSRLNPKRGHGGHLRPEDVHPHAFQIGAAQHDQENSAAG